MNTKIFLVETQVGRKPPLQLLSLQYFIIEKTCYNICAGADLTSTQAPTCARLPASPGRELQPPDSFTSLSWKGATTPWLKATTLRTNLDHVSSIFTLDPTTSIEQHLQATFHHIFRLDPFQTFKHKHTLPTDTYQHRSDSRNTAEQISYFIPFASANPSLHTRFPFTDVAYIRAFIHINQRIPQCIFYCAYALSLRWSCVYTRFLRGEVAYRSSIITEQHTSSDQIFSSDLPFCFSQMFA